MFYFLPVFSAFLLLMADRLTKWLVSSNMSVGQSVDILPGFARLFYIKNNGAAFGLLSGGRWLFVVIAAAAVCALGWFYVKLPRGKGSAPLRACLVIVAAGIVGNGFDRAVYGEVIDFIDFTFMKFAVFNFADICITCGAAAIVFFTLFGPIGGAVKNGENGENGEQNGADYEFKKRGARGKDDERDA